MKKNSTSKKRVRTTRKLLRILHRSKLNGDDVCTILASELLLCRIIMNGNDVRAGWEHALLDLNEEALVHGLNMILDQTASAKH